jgi:F-type H+-transporting ATPase subunit b
MLWLVTPAYAQEEPHAAPAAEGEHTPGELHEGTEEHGGAHGAFPPFDPATYGSQLLWLVVFFGLLYVLMSKVALPRIAGIIEARDNRVAGDLAEAGRLKEETDAAIAAYEQALATARQNAHGIAQQARDEAKSKTNAERASIEADLRGKLDAAETHIAEVKAGALAEVDAIAREATETMVEVLLGPRVTQNEVAGAVQSVLGNGGQAE